jgi:hypothetical protein
MSEPMKFVSLTAVANVFSTPVPALVTELRGMTDRERAEVATLVAAVATPTES